MKVRQWITGIVLFLLVAAAVGGMGGAGEFPAPKEEAPPPPADTTPANKVLGKKPPVTPRPLVDQRPLQTARRMAALAGTPEEQALAHQAEKTGDHEVDLAFFDALRTAEENPPALSPEAKEISERKKKAELALKDDQEGIAALTRKLAAVPEAQQDNLQEQTNP